MIPIDFHEPIFRKEKNGTYSVNANLVKLFKTHGYEIITADIYKMLIDSHVRLTTQKEVFEIEAEPVVHAKWIESKLMYKCSNCGAGTASGMANYCFMCGAKMDGDRYAYKQT